MKCPHCGKWILHRTRDEETMQHVLESLRDIPQPFSMNKDTTEIVGNEVGLPGGLVWQVWNKLRLRRDLIEKVAGYGPVAEWRVRDREDFLKFEKFDQVVRRLHPTVLEELEKLLGSNIRFFSLSEEDFERIEEGDSVEMCGEEYFAELGDARGDVAFVLRFADLWGRRRVLEAIEEVLEE